MGRSRLDLNCGALGIVAESVDALDQLARALIGHAGANAVGDAPASGKPHSLTVLSSLPEASSLPSALNATEFTGFSFLAILGAWGIISICVATHVLSEWTASKTSRAKQRIRMHRLASSHLILTILVLAGLACGGGGGHAGGSDAGLVLKGDAGNAGGTGGTNAATSASASSQGGHAGTTAPDSAVGLGGSGGTSAIPGAGANAGASGMGGIAGTTTIIDAAVTVSDGAGATSVGGTGGMGTNVVGGMGGNTGAAETLGAADAGLGPVDAPAAAGTGGTAETVHATAGSSSAPAAGSGGAGGVAVSGGAGAVAGSSGTPADAPAAGPDAPVDSMPMPGGDARADSNAGQTPEIGAATITISPTAADFGTVPVDGASTPTVFTVTNSGTTSTDRLAPGVSVTNALDFPFVGDTCTGSSLAPGETCTITLRLLPQSPGSKAALLVVGGHAAPIALTGTASLPAPPVDCQVSDWSTWSTCSNACGGGEQTRTRTVVTTPGLGGVLCPATSETQPCNPQLCPNPTLRAGNWTGTYGTGSYGLSFIVDASGNIGTFTMTVAVTTASRSEMYEVTHPGPIVVSNGAFEFKIDGSVAGGSNCSLFNTCQNLTVKGQVSSRTGITGTWDGTFTSSSDGGVSSGTTGTGVVWSARSDCSKVPSSGTSSTRFCLGIPQPPSLSLSPPSANFGSQPVAAESTEIRFTVNNLSGTTAVPNVQLSNALDYLLVTNTCTSGVTAWEPCTVGVVFRPSQLSVSAAIGALTVTAGPGMAASSMLLGTSISPLSVSPASQSFSATVGASSGTTAFTITNAAGISSDVLQILPGGLVWDQFAATTDGCTGTSLSPGQSCVVGVRFVPTSSGSKASTFVVRNIASWLATAVLTGTATTGSY